MRFSCSTDHRGGIAALTEGSTTVNAHAQDLYGQLLAAPTDVAYAFEKYWRSFYRIHDQAHADLRVAFSTLSSSHSHTSPSEDGYGLDRTFADEAESIINTLVDLARVRFGFGATRLPINEASYHRNFLPNRRRDGFSWSEFSPAAVWNALEEDHGSGKGRSWALNITARRLRLGLGINAEDDPAIIHNGKLTSKVAIWPEATSKGKRLTPRSFDRFRMFMDAFVTFMLLAGFQESAESMKGHSLYGCGPYEAYIQSRRVDRYGPISLRSTYQYVEVVMVGDVIDRLQVFLAKHDDQDA